TISTNLHRAFASTPKIILVWAVSAYEFTGELNDEGFSVTECLGGSMELSEDELGLRYQSFCDPRLNFEQSLDVAFLISNHFKQARKGQRQGADDVLYSELGGRGKSK
ncbi:hypothetical protein MPER_04276, partial [Moniliophthora perniciosa FA553]